MRASATFRFKASAVSSRLSELTATRERPTEIRLNQAVEVVLAIATCAVLRLHREFRDAPVMHEDCATRALKYGKTLQIAGFSFSRPLSRILHHTPF